MKKTILICLYFILVSQVYGENKKIPLPNKQPQLSKNTPLPAKNLNLKSGGLPSTQPLASKAVSKPALNTALKTYAPNPTINLKQLANPTRVAAPVQAPFAYCRPGKEYEELRKKAQSDPSIQNIDSFEKLCSCQQGSACFTTATQLQIMGLPERAQIFYQKACEQKHSFACELLKTKEIFNKKNAKDIFTQCMRNKNSTACFDAGRYMVQQGRVSEATTFYTEACKNKYMLGCVLVGELKKIMNTKNISVAQTAKLPQANKAPKIQNQKNPQSSVTRAPASVKSESISSAVPLKTLPIDKAAAVALNDHKSACDTGKEAACLIYVQTMLDEKKGNNLDEKSLKVACRADVPMACFFLAQNFQKTGILALENFTVACKSGLNFACLRQAQVMNEVGRKEDARYHFDKLCKKGMKEACKAIQ